MYILHSIQTYVVHKYTILYWNISLWHILSCPFPRVQVEQCTETSVDSVLKRAGAKHITLVFSSPDPENLLIFGCMHCPASLIVTPWSKASSKTAALVSSDRKAVVLGPIRPLLLLIHQRWHMAVHCWRQNPTQTCHLNWRHPVYLLGSTIITDWIHVFTVFSCSVLMITVLVVFNLCWLFAILPSKCTTVHNVFFLVLRRGCIRHENCGVYLVEYCLKFS